MKKLILIVAVVIINSFFFSCTVDPVIWWQTDHNGYATAHKNGMPWRANVRAVYNSLHHGHKLSIGLDVYNKYGELRESFDVQFIPRSTGIYFLDPSFNDSVVTCHYYTSGDDGHVQTGQYYVIPQISSYIIITTYDSLAAELAGLFQATVVGDTSYSHNPIPDTLFFTDGIFSTTIQN